MSTIRRIYRIEVGARHASWLKEKKIATSSGQSETYAMQSLVKEMVWARHLLAQLKLPQELPTVVQTDNEGVLKQSTKAINHTAAKHYRIAQAYIRNKVEDLTVKVVKVDTADNGADMFTKALHEGPFRRHCAEIMGPQEPVV